LNLLKNKMAGISLKYDRRNENSSVVNSLYQFSRLHLYGIEETGSILYVYIFSAVALIILLVACVNFINLFTAKAFIRGKEIGIRKVVGAGKKHIIFQFYGETFLLSVFAFGAALILAEVFLPAFNNLSDKQISLNFLSNTGLIIS